MSLRIVSASFVLALVLAIVLAWPLHAPPIAHHGEAREGLVVQSIVDRGEWILPHRNGELPSKPPLFHWLAATAVRGFGFSDGVLRLPSAVAAWGIACLTFALGCALGGAATGWLSVGALLGMVPFLTSATEARVDMVFTACVTAALVAFFFWYRDRDSSARTWMYAAVSAAVLTKGPIGAVLPALIVVAFLAAGRELRLLRDLWSTPLVALAALVDVGWYALAAAVGGREFIALQLLRENWSRLVGGHGEFRRTAHGSTLRLPVLLVTQFLPWTAAIAWSLWRRARGARMEPAERFLHAWWLIVLGVFTIAAGKRPVYLLPAAPALALLAGRMLTEVGGVDLSRWRMSVARVAVAIVIFDVGALVTLQLVRESKSRHGSLAPFAATVAQLVPGDQPVSADPAIRASDRMVLAYRLRRAVSREGAAVPGAASLVPASSRLGRWCEGATLLAESGESAHDVALMRDAAPAAERRGSPFCAPESPAGSGTAAPFAPQHSAGSRPRLMIPLGQPAPTPIPTGPSPS